MIRIGPAGWEYPDWAGVVYPLAAPRSFDRLRHLARFFTTVEVNATFYRPFSDEVAARWCERVGDAPAFRFGAKVDRLAQEGRLGAVLLQFPWSFKRAPESEEWLRGVLDAFAGLPLVVEVRHASWDAPDVLDDLARAGAGIVNVDQPLFHASMRPGARVTSPVAYVRVHGRNYRDWFRKGAGRDARYDYLYTQGELEPWAERVKELAGSARAPDVYVVTNNHFRGQAAANAKMLEGMVTGSKVSAPGELVAAFPEALKPFVV